jgi:hypothetical protein
MQQHALCSHAHDALCALSTTAGRESRHSPAAPPASAAGTRARSHQAVTPAHRQQVSTHEHRLWRRAWHRARWTPDAYTSDSTCVRQYLQLHAKCCVLGVLSANSAAHLALEVHHQRVHDRTAEDLRRHAGRLQRILGRRNLHVVHEKLFLPRDVN